MRRFVLLASLFCAGCNGWQARPLAELELFEHQGDGQESQVLAGTTLISPSGRYAVDVGPAMRFDLLGGRTEELFDNQLVGGVIRLRPLN